MSGFASLSSTSHLIIVHVSSGSSVVAGVIGGAVVLIGVLLTEALIRIREGRRRLEDATWNLLDASNLLSTGKTLGMSDKELLGELANFVRAIGRVRVAARWPRRNAHAIVAELDAINGRFMVAMAKWASDHHPNDGPPRLGPIVGERLSGLVFPGQIQARERVDAVLREAGFPALGETDPDGRHNA
jgi:hypothetical protein